MGMNRLLSREHKDIHKLATLENILRNHLLELLLNRLGTLGVTVAGKVNQVPLVVYYEVVDKKCLTRCCRRLGKTFVTAKHVDEARLPHVGATNECVLGFRVLRTLRHGGAADDKL